MFYYNDYAKSDVIKFSKELTLLVCEKFAENFEQHRKQKLIITQKTTNENMKNYFEYLVSSCKDFTDFQNTVSQIVGYNAVEIIERSDRAHRNRCKIPNRHDFVTAISYHYYNRVGVLYSAMINAIKTDKLIVSKEESKQYLFDVLNKEFENFLLIYLEYDVTGISG